MSDPSGICPSCKRSGLINGVCPMCGYSETGLLPAEPKPKSGLSRGALWLCFWVLFLGTPPLGILTLPRGGGFIILGLGTIAAGFVLSRLFAKDTATFFAWGIVFSMGIFVIYFGIAFVGCCFAMLKGSSF
jgi:hypothetical protein